MNRVVTVNLAGNAYQLEEPGYAALKEYLDRAEAALGANPDRAEILHDLERAVADRLSGMLHAFKSVATTAEVEDAIAAMGPVEAGDGPHPEETVAGPALGARRKLYRLREGAIVAGVTTGLAAYMRLDVSLVRIGLVIAAFVSLWVVALVYIIAMFIIPTADTPEDWRAAHGLPATAQEVIDSAKARFAAFEAKQDWWVWRREGPAAQPSAPPQRFTAPPAPSAGIGVRLLAGIGALVLATLGLAATLALLAAIAALIVGSPWLAFTPLPDMPLWLSLLLVTLVFGVVAAPLQSLRQACFRTVTGMDRQHAETIDTVISIGLFVLAAWALYEHVPVIAALADQTLAWFRAVDA